MLAIRFVSGSLSGAFPLSGSARAMSGNIRCADVCETCLCGHFPINNICLLTNRRNAVTVEVGDECVKRFKGINLDLVFDGLRRIKEDDSLGL